MIKKPSFFIALFPLLILICLLTCNVFLFEDTLNGPNQLSLLLVAFIGIIISHSLGFKWEAINQRIIKTIGSAMPSVIILLLIGSLSGTWLISGVVPAMIYYGLDAINPKIFLVTALIVSAIVSTVTGSSWSTIATIGVALIGIGKTIGFSEPLVAGAIISGAYFGDKMSPLSDTTNLAPAMAGTDLFTHIRYMSITTIPSMAITIILFLLIGFFYNTSTPAENIGDVKAAIDNVFNINPFLFLVPVILFTIIVFKVPAIPSMFIGTLLGAVFALLFQNNLIHSIANEPTFLKASYVTIMQAMFGDITINTHDTMVNELLTTGGMRGMLNTVWLILSAMIFGWRYGSRWLARTYYQTNRRTCKKYWIFGYINRFFVYLF
jgi:Na+:H+ antiporter, NhaC family